MAVNLAAHIKSLRDIAARAPDVADALIHDAAQLLEERARVAAPKSEGMLAHSIFVRRDGPMRRTVIANIDYAADQEYGTGDYGSMPARAPDLDALEAWCRRHGMEEYLWPIYIKLSRHGHKAQPYMGPQVKPVRAKLVADAKAALSKLTRGD